MSKRSRTTMHLFGRRLRVLRKTRKWTIEELGRKASLGYKHLADLERGVKSPSFQAIDRLSAALGVHPYQLFLPSTDPDSDLSFRFKDLIMEFERIDSLIIKRFLVDVLDACERVNGAMATAKTKAPSR